VGQGPLFLAVSALILVIPASTGSTLASRRCANRCDECRKSDVGDNSR
jgi:hypothetical protein